MANFNYTVLRQANTDEKPEDSLSTELWIAVDVQASSAKEAVLQAADIPATYLVYESDPVVFEVDNVTRLEVIQRDE